MNDSMDFPKIPLKIAHIAEPRRYPVGQIMGCFAINLNAAHIQDPFWKEGQSKDERYIPGHKLYEMMLAHGWQTSMIGWTRDDGPVNFGHEPAVQHVLMAVMVKLKGDQ